jgi:peptide/nickel transport system permease protein
MSNYILRRLILNVLVLWMVASLVFVAVRALPGDFVLQQVASNLELASHEDAIKQARHALGTDRPLWRQYVSFMGDLVRGDLGRSYATHRTTWAELADRVPYTLELGILITLVSFGISIPVGIISAMKQDTWLDYVLRGFSILAVAAPVFFIAVIFLFFVLRFHLWSIDIIGRPHLWTAPKKALLLYIIPAVAGGITGGGGIMRLLRSQMLEVLRQDYIRTARAKGIQDHRVILAHALKNAMVPVLTVMGLTISGIIGGQIILENMFNIPGVGQFLFSRLQNRDFPPFQGTVVLIAVVIVTVNLLVDVLYAWLDPRIRYS